MPDRGVDDAMFMGQALLSCVPFRVATLDCSCLQHVHLEALRSTELSGGLGRPGSSEEDTSPASLGSMGKLGSGINPELMDLSCMMSPGSAASPEAHREEVGPQWQSEPTLSFLRQRTLLHRSSSVQSSSLPAQLFQCLTSDICSDGKVYPMLRTSWRAKLVYPHRVHKVPGTQS